MCCYKDYKNFERFNNLVQLVLHRAIGFIESLPSDSQTSSHNVGLLTSTDNAATVSVKGPMTPPSRDDDVDVDVMSVDTTDVDGGTDGTTANNKPEGDTSSAEKTNQNIPVSVEELTDDTSAIGQGKEPHASTSENTTDNECGESEEWSLDEKERLFQFIAKVFTPSFPLYFAYKHCIHSSLEDLSKQDACALNNYCELNVSTAFLFSVYLDSPHSNSC